MKPVPLVFEINKFWRWVFEGNLPPPQFIGLEYPVHRHPAHSIQGWTWATPLIRITISFLATKNTTHVKEKNLKSVLKAKPQKPFPNPWKPQGSPSKPTEVLWTVYRRNSKITSAALTDLSPTTSHVLTRILLVCIQFQSVQEQTIGAQHHRQPPQVKRLLFCVKWRSLRVSVWGGLSGELAGCAYYAWAVLAAKWMLAYGSGYILKRSDVLCGEPEMPPANKIPH